MSVRWTQFVIGCAVVSLATGCHIRPRQGPPGTIGVQRERAVIHDPFPSNELGPPIMGGRPLGFETPQSEPTSIQGNPWSGNSRRGGSFQQPYGF